MSKEINIENLIDILEENTNYRFVECKGGIVTLFETGEVIPTNHMLYNKPPKKDGFYRVTEYTCGGSKSGGCEIGNPNEDCVDSGMYSVQKCSVYGFRLIDDIFITFKDLKLILTTI